MNITALIFTHQPDYPLAIIAATQLERLGVRAVLCIDNAESKDPAWHLVDRTLFDRSGNLNGIECVKGILKLMAHWGQGMDWVIKVDSDVFMASLDWLLKRLPRSTNPPEAVGFTFPPMRGSKGIYGAAYAIRPARLQELYEKAEFRGEQRQRAEDMIMGTLCDKFIHRHVFGNGKGLLRFWRWDEDDDPGQALDRYQVLGIQRIPNNPSAGREACAAKMRALLDCWSERMKSPTK